MTKVEHPEPGKHLLKNLRFIPIPHQLIIPIILLHHLILTVVIIRESVFIIYVGLVWFCQFYFQIVDGVDFLQKVSVIMYFTEYCRLLQDHLRGQTLHSLDRVGQVLCSHKKVILRLNLKLFYIVKRRRIRQHGHRRHNTRHNKHQYTAHRQRHARNNLKTDFSVGKPGHLFNALPEILADPERQHIEHRQEQLL